MINTAQSTQSAIVALTIMGIAAIVLLSVIFLSKDWAETKSLSPETKCQCAPPKDSR